jgi:hypothetical protein
MLYLGNLISHCQDSRLTREEVESLVNQECEIVCKEIMKLCLQAWESEKNLVAGHVAAQREAEKTAQQNIERWQKEKLIGLQRNKILKEHEDKPINRF